MSRSPSSGCPSLGQMAGGQLPISCGRGCVVVGSGPLACVPHLAMPAAGSQEVAPGGGSSQRCEVCLGISALPLPVARPWGGWQEPAACFFWA